MLITNGMYMIHRLYFWGASLVGLAVAENLPHPGHDDTHSSYMLSASDLSIVDNAYLVGEDDFGDIPLPESLPQCLSMPDFEYCETVVHGIEAQSMLADGEVTVDGLAISDLRDMG